MRVLLSIRPEHVENILNGSKQFEYRKKIFKRTNIHSVIVYCTKPIGKIVAEFKIEQIIEGTPREVWNLTSDSSGITESFFFSYYSGRSTAFALKIGHVMRYEQPIEPFKISKSFTPPQSYMYVEDDYGVNWLKDAQSELFECQIKNRSS